MHVPQAKSTNCLDTQGDFKIIAHDKCEKYKGTENGSRSNWNGICR